MQKYWISGKYLTVPEIAKLPQCQVTLRSIYYHLSKGESIEEAITKKTDRVMYKGQYFSIAELVKLSHCIVSYIVLRQRIKRGWDIDQALRTPARDFTQTEEGMINENLKKIFITPINPKKCRYTRGGWR